MNNRWNQIIYKVWSPMYDAFFNSGPFLKARKKVFQDLQFQSGDRILFVGVGTGADIEQIPHHQLEITAIDFSEDMLQKAKQKFTNSSITFLQMDAQQLNFTDETFDYVMGSLILSVVPDGEKALKEMVRVSKPEGTIILFDKFMAKGKGLTFIKKIMRNVIKFLGTDIGRSFEELYKGTKGEALILKDEEVMFNGMYRKIVLKKIS